MARKTLKLPEDEYEYHNERRKEHGLTWAEYVNGEAPDLGIDYDRIREIVRDEVRSEVSDQLAQFR